MRVFDRRTPKDWRHVEQHPLRGLHGLELPAKVERVLPIPRQYREEYDQGSEGACVGYSQSWMMSILNRQLYDAFRLYAAAQAIDEWPDTPPQEGTSLRAGFDVLRTVGHWQVWAGKTRAPKLVHGIESNKWATTVDEVRASINAGLPVNLGCNWHDSFSRPENLPRTDDQGKKPLFGKLRSDWWIGRGDWGDVVGGHAICVAAASDARQAFGLVNSWGLDYPFLVWISYDGFSRLLTDDGEAGVIVDRITK